MTLDEISEKILPILDERFGIVGDDYLPNEEYPLLEHVAHEIGHWTTLGLRNFHIEVSDSMGNFISKLSARRADENEAKALAVEVGVLAAIGYPVTRPFYKALIKAATDGLRAGDRQWLDKRVQFYLNTKSIAPLIELGTKLMTTGQAR